MREMREGGFLIREVLPSESSYALQSVGLVLIDRAGQYYVFQEMMSKWWIGKALNNWSFPWETREDGESDETALGRVLSEEVGEDVVLANSPQLLTAFEFADSHAVFYWAPFEKAESLGGHAGTTGETKNHGWASPIEVNTRITRVGIRWVLQRLREENIGHWSQ